MQVPALFFSETYICYCIGYWAEPKIFKRYFAQNCKYAGNFLVELDKNLNNDTSIGFVLRKISRIIQTEVSVICQSESRFQLHPTIIPLTTIINYQHDRGDNRSHNSFVNCLRFILYFFKLKQYSTVITY